MPNYDSISSEIAYFGYGFYDDRLTPQEVEKMEQAAKEYFNEAQEKFENYLKKNHLTSVMGLIKKKRGRR